MFVFSSCGINKNIDITTTDVATTEESTTESTITPSNITITLKDECELTKIEHLYPELKNIKDISINKNLFITNDGSLYYISFDKPCSNGQYCIKIDTEIKFSKFYSNIFTEVLLSEDNELYDCVYTDDGWDFVRSEEVEQHLIRNNIKREDFKDAIYIPSFKDGELYGRRIFYVRDTYLEHFSNSKLNLFNESTKEIDWHVDNTIKSNDNYYAYFNKQINIDECSKYADVQPVYELNFHKVNISVENVIFFKYIEYTDKKGEGYCAVVDSEGAIYFKQF
jgi:hypothetical protein